MNPDHPLNIEQARERIDALDDQLCCLFTLRLAYVDQIGAQKAQHKQQTADPTREEKILSRLRAQTEPRFQSDIEALYRAIFTICRQRQGRY